MRKISCYALKSSYQPPRQFFFEHQSSQIYWVQSYMTRTFTSRPNPSCVKSSYGKWTTKEKSALKKQVKLYPNIEVLIDWSVMTSTISLVSRPITIKKWPRENKFRLWNANCFFPSPILPGHYFVIISFSNKAQQITIEEQLYFQQALSCLEGRGSFWSLWIQFLAKLDNSVT